MKHSSTRSGPSCSGFWDTVRNNLTIREMTALMGGDGTMEQQTEKDFRFENDPQAEVFLLSEKQKKKHQAFLPRALCGASSGTRTLGPLIKRASRGFVSIYGSFEPSLFLIKAT